MTCDFSPEPHHKAAASSGCTWAGLLSPKRDGHPPSTATKRADRRQDYGETAHIVARAGEWTDYATAISWFRQVSEHASRAKRFGAVSHTRSTSHNVEEPQSGGENCHQRKIGMTFAWSASSAVEAAGERIPSSRGSAFPVLRHRRGRQRQIRARVTGAVWAHERPQRGPVAAHFYKSLPRSGPCARHQPGFANCCSGGTEQQAFPSSQQTSQSGHRRALVLNPSYLARDIDCRIEPPPG